jgi:hypothetical protein
MSNINLGKVILGGLVAGVVYNIGEAILNMGILAKDMEEFSRKYQLPAMEGSFIMKMTLLMFVFGIVTVWLYAAIRPRFGAGIKTAVIAGVAVWFLSFFYATFLMHAIGLFATAPSVKGAVWELGEAVLAAIAGAWVYKET